MAGRYQLITELYRNSVREVTRNPENWTRFLQSACRNFRCRFDEQILIYAQRPDARAVLGLEDWKNRYGRWINHGAESIVVFDDTPRGNVPLKYYFDIADTHMGRGAKAFSLWKMKQQYEEEVIESLENRFGELSDKTIFSNAVLSAAENAAQDNLPDYLDDLMYCLDDSFLEGLEKESVGVLYRNLVKSSVAYMVLTRCGYPTEGCLMKADFEDIHNFNTPETINALGIATSDIAEMGLAEISSTIRSIQKRERHTVAETKKVPYNGDRNKSIVDDRNSELQLGRSEEYGNNLYEERKVPDAGSDFAGGKQRNSPWKIRITSPELPERAPKSAVYEPADQRETISPSDRDTDGCKEPSGDINSTDDGKSGSDRGIKKDRSDEVARDEKQYSTGGRRNRTQRADLQLSGYPEKTEGEPLPSFSLPAEKENTQVLTQGRASAGQEPALQSYELHPGETIYIGTSPYEILSMDAQVVRLQDMTYPLFQDELSWEDFERKLRENPANDHLISPHQAEALDNSITLPQKKPLQEEHTTSLPAGKKQSDNLVPAWKSRKNGGRLESYDLYPEIPASNRHEYHITDDKLSEGGPKEKFRANLQAIHVLRRCEKEGRYATPEEQDMLAVYTGWGGLPEAFNESNPEWAGEYVQLKAALSEEDYASARESSLTAFYTPPVVIWAMYRVLENMGLKKGNILEPACATGNFIGMKPDTLSECKMYGVELDRLSGRIAQQLYQNTSIAIKGFEEVAMPDNFFDVVIGNVPFGNFKVSDRRYDSQNFLIHDYFFAKSIDKVRPLGVLALITSNGMSGGTFDKRDSRIRRYLAQRCDLLGAIRLPNNTFMRVGGTDVTTDILFLQKREIPRDLEADLPDWVEAKVLDESYYEKESGEVRHTIITMNRYYEEHPEMVLGEQEIVMGAFHPQMVCKPFPDMNLEQLLDEAVQHIQGEIAQQEREEEQEEMDASIPADPSVQNFSFALAGGRLYYRENSRMWPVHVAKTTENRIREMMGIRDTVRTLILYQMEDYPKEDIRLQQNQLNLLYDKFYKRYGQINDRANDSAFSDDSSYPLLCSLEILDENGKAHKADIFSKRTIRSHIVAEKADTASEALALSLSERARVDMEYMCTLTEKDADTIELELQGVIFRIPDSKGKEPHFVPADEYLSGNVRQKLKEAQIAVKENPIYQSNVEALEKVQPEELSATDINVRLGAVWIPTDDIERFIYEFLGTPSYQNIKVQYSTVTGAWSVEGKNRDKGNVKAEKTYGTSRANAYRIIEDSLNLRDIRIFDYVEEGDGKKRAILNKKETAIAQGKQELIKQAFSDWIWKDPERRQRLTRFYNDTYNSVRPREFDGNHLSFHGINPTITLRESQKNGVARILYGGNTLLAHVVGAGKTYTMIAAAMESKRLGLCHKCMVVVPNHLVEQWASDWLHLYPAANIMVTNKRDFEMKRRKKFCARIATSDVDAVIIGYSQFEKIPVSAERQSRMIRDEINELVFSIDEIKRRDGDKFSIKQMERMKKKLQGKLKRLHDQSRKDQVVDFEELGIDRLFVDEADNFKNLYLYTKMRNVGGIGQTEAMKASDLYLKCRYLDEITGGKGVIFATGTPVSNTMAELYTMQRYLQYPALIDHNLQHFDAWASTFGETVTAIELAPEGTGYRAKTRFARFYNLPELMSMFRQVADIQTADMLNLPVPKANYKVVSVKPTKTQQEMVADLAVRAERVRNGMVESFQDNMLVITNDGRKLALDQRLMNELLPDEPESKVNACVEELYRRWDEGREERLTQIVFCDLSVPKGDGHFNVYDDIRNKLTERGVPKEEVAFIHEADSGQQKKELFSKVRRGKVRILMGSTARMGAGTNVQDLLIASHDLDCPWRPRDLEQRAGRTVRQGNKNEEVDIIRYVTEGTFDAYLYQLIENKQRFISQIMTSKNPMRVAEDVDETALSYAEIKALATGNPHIKEKMDLDIEMSRLKLLKQNYLNQKYELEDSLTQMYPRKIKALEQHIENYRTDMETVRKNAPKGDKELAMMQVGGTTYSEKKEAGQAILDACKAMKSPDAVPLGSYRGLKMELYFNTFSREYVITLKGAGKYPVTMGTDSRGNITRIDHALASMEGEMESTIKRLDTVRQQREDAEKEVQKPFIREQELREKSRRLQELNALLNMDEKDVITLDDEPNERETQLEQKETVWER